MNARLLSLLALLLSACATATGREPTATDHPPQTKDSTAMTRHATGTFDVKLVPFPADADRGDSPIGRMSNDKQFHGDIDGSSRGQMLMLGTAVQGSAAYVSIEVVTGKVHGRSGSFALHHDGVMNRGVGQLAIGIVPDSGTDQLQGIAGTFAITIEKGVHHYDLDYSLPEAAASE